MTKEDRPGMFSWMSPGSPKKKWPESKLKNPIVMRTGDIGGRARYELRPGQKDPSEQRSVRWGENIPYSRDGMPVRWWDRDFEEDPDENDPSGYGIGNVARSVPTKWWEKKGTMGSDEGILPWEWWTKPDEIDLNDYDFGEKVEGEDGSEDGDDDGESDEFYNTMSGLMREIGEADIQKIILGYFKKVTDNRSLRMESDVIARPTTPGLERQNRIALKLCMHDNWESIRDVYPCLSDFKFHLVEADLMYEFHYPYLDTKTGTLHGVEKVKDFSDFILDFIVTECMPCVRKPSNTCMSMGDKMKRSLELCSKTKCSESRKKLLRFFIHHINKKDVEGDIVVEDMDVDEMDVDASASAELQGYHGTGTPPPSTTMPSWGIPVDKAPSPKEVNFWSKENSVFYEGSEMGNMAIEEAKKRLREIENGIFDIFQHTEQIQDQVYDKDSQEIQNKMNTYGKIEDFDSLRFVANAIPDNGYYYRIGLVEGEPKLLGVSIGSVEVEISEVELEEIESVIKSVAGDVMKGELSSLARIYRSKTKDKSPLNMKIEGGFRDGKWTTRYVVIVATDRMTIANIHSLAEVQDRQMVGLAKTEVFLEDQVRLIADFTGIQHLVGEVMTASSAEGKEIMERIGGKRFNVVGNPESDVDNVAVAKAMTQLSNEGSRYHDNEELDRNVGMFILSEKTFNQDPAILGRFMKLLGDEMEKDKRAGEIKSGNDLEVLIKKSEFIYKKYLENMGAAKAYEEQLSSGEKMNTDEIKAMVQSGSGLTEAQMKELSAETANSIEVLRKGIYDHLQKTYAVRGSKALDKVALKNSSGYSRVKELRDSAIRNKDNPDHEDVKKFKNVTDKAKQLRMTGQSNLSIADKFLRVEHHRTGIHDLPMGLVGFYKAFWGLKGHMEGSNAHNMDKTIDSLFAGEQIETLREMKMSDVISWSNDQEFAYDMETDDSVLHWYTSQAFRIIGQSAVFLLFIAWLNYRALQPEEVDNTLLTDEMKRNQFWKVKRLRTTRNTINVLAGGAFFTPLLVLQVGALLVHGANNAIRWVALKPGAPEEKRVPTPTPGPKPKAKSTRSRAPIVDIKTDEEMRKKHALRRKKLAEAGTLVAGQQRQLRSGK